MAIEAKRDRKPVFDSGASLAETGFLALRFTACLAGLYALWLSPAGQGCANGLATAYVRAGQTVVSMLGEPGIVHGATFFSRGQPVMTVATACTGSEFFLLLGAAILAFPATAAARAAGLLTGGVGLAGLGVLRIVSLYWVQVYRPGAFLAAHEEVWPAILAVATLAFLGSWIGCVQSRGHA